MPSYLWEIVIILLLINLNGLFSMAEIAVVSARKTRLRQLAEEGDAKAAAAAALTDNPNQFLATIQIGITLVGVLSGAFGGATLAGKIEPAVARIPSLAPYSRGISLALVVGGISYLTLVLGELVPKRLGLNNPENVARSLAKPMKSLAGAASPLVSFLSLSTDLVLRLLRIKKSEEPPITEEEIRGLIRQGTEYGLFEESEQDMVERVLRLDDRSVGAIMTPRTRAVWLDINDSPAENQAKVIDNGYTRYLVCDDNLDDVIGMVHVKDLLRQFLEKKQFEVSSTAKEILFLPENMRILEALERFRQTGESLAVVINEYGNIEGIVTLTDILGAVVGEILTTDQDRPGYLVRDDGSWLIDGLLPLETLGEIMGIDVFPGEEEGHFRTAAGFVIYQLGRIPQEKDSFLWNEWRFEVVDMDGHRVDKVLLVKEEPVPDELL
ncbi:MAG: hemolysin family protein [bacterium]